MRGPHLAVAPGIMQALLACMTCVPHELGPRRHGPDLPQGTKRSSGTSSLAATRPGLNCPPEAVRRCRPRQGVPIFFTAEVHLFRFQAGTGAEQRWYMLCCDLEAACSA